MKPEYLIDTNILISLFNDELAEPIPDGNIGYSIITEIDVKFYFSGICDRGLEHAITKCQPSADRILITPID